MEDVSVLSLGRQIADVTREGWNDTEKCVMCKMLRKHLTGCTSTEMLPFGVTLHAEYVWLCFVLRRCCDGAERNLYRIDDLNGRIEDRNRTTPVSSCGNGFEFRVVGSHEV